MGGTGTYREAPLPGLIGAFCEGGAPETLRFGEHKTPRQKNDRGAFFWRPGGNQAFAFSTGAGQRGQARASAPFWLLLGPKRGRECCFGPKSQTFDE
jgi:hypothetical protein